MSSSRLTLFAERMLGIMKTATGENACFPGFRAVKRFGRLTHSGKIVFEIKYIDPLDSTETSFGFTILDPDLADEFQEHFGSCSCHGT